MYSKRYLPPWTYNDEGRKPKTTAQVRISPSAGKSLLLSTSESHARPGATKSPPACRSLHGKSQREALRCRFRPRRTCAAFWRRSRARRWSRTKATTSTASSSATSASSTTSSSSSPPTARRGPSARGCGELADSETASLACVKPVHAAPRRGQPPVTVRLRSCVASPCREQRADGDPAPLAKCCHLRQRKRKQQQLAAAATTTRQRRRRRLQYDGCDPARRRRQTVEYRSAARKGPKSDHRARIKSLRLALQSKGWRSVGYR